MVTMTWQMMVDFHYHNLIAYGSLNEGARQLAAESGRPYETCRTALRRYKMGKIIRKLHPKCERCARIRTILGEQQP